MIMNSFLYYSSSANTFVHTRRGFTLPLSLCEVLIFVDIYGCFISISVIDMKLKSDEISDRVTTLLLLSVENNLWFLQKILHILVFWNANDVQRVYQPLSDLREKTEQEFFHALKNTVICENVVRTTLKFDEVTSVTCISWLH